MLYPLDLVNSHSRRCKCRPGEGIWGEGENPRGDDIVTTVCVARAVQRLVLIMPVEELTKPVMVKDH